MAHSGKIDVRRGVSTDALSFVRLRILATSDLHAHLFPYNYYADRRDDSVGLARAASLIGGLCQEASNCILVDNGDTLQGAPLGDAAMAEILPKGRPHPMIAAMNALSYDAATLGNHDFDYGLSFLTQACGAANYPIVLANARRKDGSSLFPGHTILERDCIDAAGKRPRLRIGLIGVLPPQTAQWNATVLGDELEIEDMAVAVRRELVLLRAARADVVVVLAHSGLGQPDAPPMAENAAVAISHIPGVDALIAGHSHGVHAGAVDGGAPIVQPGFWGSHIGVIDLDLMRSAPAVAQDAAEQAEATPKRPWHVVNSEAGLHPLSSDGPEARRSFRNSLRGSPELRAQLSGDHRLTRAFTSRPLGAVDQPLETYFSQLAPCAALHVLADAKRVAAERLIEHRPELQRLPMIVVVAPFKAGGRGGPANYTNVPAGRLRLRHAADLYVYPNTLFLLRATGVQVRAWLERAAAAFRQIDPDGQRDMPQPLIDHAFPGYNFDQFDGLSYAFDLREPALTSADGARRFSGPGRVRDLCLADGRPLAPQDEVLLVTNSYRAAGGGHFPDASNAEHVLNSSDPVREAVARYIASRPLLKAGDARPVWRFTSLGGVPVRVDTGPGALQYPDRIAELGLKDLGLGPTGFQQFLWHL